MQEVLEPLTGKALFFMVASRESPYESGHGRVVSAARKVLHLCGCISGCCLVASTRERKERVKEADESEGEDECGVK
jgi:hypothetical protein